MKDAAPRKKEAHKTMCQNSTEENKTRHKSMKNNAASTAMREKEREGERGTYLITTLIEWEF